MASWLRNCLDLELVNEYEALVCRRIIPCMLTRDCDRLSRYDRRDLCYLEGTNCSSVQERLPQPEESLRLKSQAKTCKPSEDGCHAIGR